jgi:hypothetical protein
MPDSLGRTDLGNLESRSNHTDRHYFELSESTCTIQKNYEVVGEVDLLHLSSSFPDHVYGVSSIAGMTADEAVIIGQALQRWGQARGAKTLPPDGAAPMLEVAAATRNA